MTSSLRATDRGLESRISYPIWKPRASRGLAPPTVAAITHGDVGCLLSLYFVSQHRITQSRSVRACAAAPQALIYARYFLLNPDF